MDRPMIYSGSMVRALLEGRKTQTRRILKPQPRGTPWFWAGDEVDPVPTWFDGWEEGWDSQQGGALREVNKPLAVRYAVGDRLYVRESITRSGALVQYMADHKTSLHVWGADWKQDPRPSIHMPRWASRLTLTVTEVRVQRLQDISEEDAAGEGVWSVYDRDAHRTPSSARECFSLLWGSIHGPGAWGANPWIVAVSFTVARGNIDQQEAA